MTELKKQAPRPTAHSLKNLRRGNPGNKGTSGSFAPRISSDHERRKKILDLLSDSINEDTKKPFIEDLTFQLMELAKKDATTAQYMLSQFIGHPRSVIKYEFGNEEVALAVGRVIAKFVPQEKVKEAMEELFHELGIGTE